MFESPHPHHFVLDNDIELTGIWTPICWNRASFKGTFDGQGFSISGMNVRTNAFQNDFPLYLGTGAEIPYAAGLFARTDINSVIKLPEGFAAVYTWTALSVTAMRPARLLKTAYGFCRWSAALPGALKGTSSTVTLPVIQQSLTGREIRIHTIPL